MRRSYLIALAVLGISVVVLYTAVTSSLTGQTGRRPGGKKDFNSKSDAKSESEPKTQPPTTEVQDKPKRDFKGWPPRGPKSSPQKEIARGPFYLKFRKGQAKFDGALDPGDEAYRSKKNAKAFMVLFEAGKTYQIDHKSTAFDAYLYLENPEGEVIARDDDSGGNLNARIVYEASTTGTYKIMATNLGELRPGPSPFSLTVKVIAGSGPGGLPKGLPPWFVELDANEDAQVSLAEWRAGGKKLEEFRDYDLDDDGFITPDEVLRAMRRPIDVAGDNGQKKFNHAIEQNEQDYRGKKAFRSYPINMERGKTYQIECISKEFWAFLYLEDPSGELLAEHNSGGNDKISRIIHRATMSGTHRLIATSLGGFRTGDLSLTVREMSGASGGTLPKGMPAWFGTLDKDGDGQISLAEWRAGGKKLDDFAEYDLNDDGFITPDEVLRFASRPMDLPAKGEAVYKHTLVETPDQLHRGKKSYRIYNVRMIQGRSYQIDLISKEFQAFLYLEDADGSRLDEHSSPTVGGTSRLFYTPSRSGTYRIVATSMGGFRVGDYAMTINVMH